MEEMGKLRVPEHVVRRQFGPQTVILNLETGYYHGLNTTGGRILDVIEETNDPKEAARRVAEEFDAPIDVVTGDVDRLCSELVERGLLVTNDA
jgi:hypothetical protein